jgi:hypothetical protein
VRVRVRVRVRVEAGAARYIVTPVTIALFHGRHVLLCGHFKISICILFFFFLFSFFFLPG